MLDSKLDYVAILLTVTYLNTVCCSKTNISVAHLTVWPYILIYSFNRTHSRAMDLIYQKKEKKGPINLLKEITP